MSLYLEHHASLCLLDDKNARQVATLHHIHVTGTLGILIEAKRHTIIPTVKPLMDMLRTQHTFWIRDDMYRHVLSLTDELNE